MAVDPNIKKKANDIRNKVYGKEVRESLASGLEEMSSDVVENEGRQSVVEGRQDSVESQWQSVIDETTNLDVVSAPEIIAARDGEANLKVRLDKEHEKVATQAAHSLINKANAYEQLIIPTYDGSNQPTHPSVLYFENGWNGWNYWMAYTPFPNDTEALENPSIAVSNYGVNWHTPEGLQNPLAEPTETELEGGWYYSDSDLVFNSTTGRLECWYRFYTPVTKQTLIKRRTTLDGVNWSTEEIMIDDRMLSPSLIFENNKYRLWATGNNQATYRESSDGLNWSEPQVLNLDLPENHRPWHIDVIKTAKGYEMLLNTTVTGRGLQRELVHSVSSDGINWGDFEVIIKPSVGRRNFDSYAIYRATMVVVDGVYNIYYSAHNNNKFWGIGLSEGPSARETVGYFSNVPRPNQSITRLNLKGTDLENPARIKMFNEGISGVNILVDDEQANTLKINNDANTALGNLKLDDLKADTLSARQLHPTSGPFRIASYDGKSELRLTAYEVGDITLSVSAKGTLDILTSDGASSHGNMEVNRLGANRFVGELFDVRGDSENPARIKMVNYGFSGVNILVDEEETNTLKINNDGNTRLGNLKANQVILGGNDVAGVEGAIRFNSTTKKHQGFDGTNWNDLY